ncbi:MAG: aminotransferase class I/II-fold pyridoxal phosphate-dependent enzyme [Sphingobacteriales bacterium]|uniref:methionine aminotransferase n=1 Tax=Hydrotalea flava TaxID=714549 RepID=UPI0008304272|nr:methionine aminotransferase [Hydrotalea flava]RTL49992.1 MAG: aminotransferase class I/II-fold pyridoxal phosphate-dependent enzyme [Sphingobacteriales bacterium]
MHIASKLPQVGTTIFTIMSQLAQQHHAINLGQGFPDFMMDEALIDLIQKAMIDGCNQYTHTNGLPALRNALAEKVKKLYNTSIHPETQITITPGGTYAIYTALTSFLYSGDEVIVFEPAYDSYVPNIVLNGAKPVFIALQYPDYSIPWHEVAQKINSKTKAIIINSPHNPTGAVLSEQDIMTLRTLVAKTNIMIVSDEVYEHLIFDAIPHQSLLRYPDLLERSFIIFSFGKTYHCTGWKLGYCIAAAPLMQEFRKVHQFNCFSCDTPKQYALATYLQEEDKYVQLGAQIQKKRDFFRTLMQQTGFVCIPSHGSYFECYSYAALSNKPDTEFAVELVQKAGVATIPVSAFYHHKTDEKVLRFCFAKKEETLLEAAERLKHL